MNELTRDDFKEHRDEMRELFRGVYARLDVQNGRLGRAEQQIAVLTDRSNREWWERLLSGGIGASLVGAAAFFKSKLNL